jgi:hypothetical protein
MPAPSDELADAAARFYRPLRQGPEQLATGAQLNAEYTSAQPFAHILLKDFFDDDYLRRLRAEIPSPLVRTDLFHADVKNLQEHKFAWRDVPRLGPISHEMIGFLGSKPFLEYLSALTGIPGLMADPHLWGGGFHQIIRGGKLAVHADFNIHPITKVYRRLNLILYLNEDWKEEWGGSLELWNRDMTVCARRIAPAFNHTVIFSTTEDSYHGHADPLTCPPERVRQSLALYYYTHEYLVDHVHSTLWQDRPQDGGKVKAAMEAFQRGQG